MTEVKSATASTKRRRSAAGSIITESPASALSRRITRMAKTMKAANPTHMYPFSAPGTWTSISTTGTLIALCDQIQQGDDYTQRFGNHVDVNHLNIKLVFQPGSAAAATIPVRITVFTAAQNFVFGTAMNSTYSPIASGGVTRLIYDQYLQIAAATATAGFPTTVNKSLKFRFRQKFSGSGTTTQTGDTLFMIIQSTVAAGTSAPTLSAGVVEIFFKP